MNITRSLWLHFLVYVKPNVSKSINLYFDSHFNSGTMEFLNRCSNETLLFSISVATTKNLQILKILNPKIRKNTEIQNKKH